MTRTKPFASQSPAALPSSNPVSPLSVLSVAAALALGLTALDASALTLGRLNVQSALGEPLRAEIDVTELGPGEADGLRVVLASRAAFQAAGVAYNDALANVQTALQRRANGSYVVRLTGTRPLNEPFVDLLVEANWASGRIVRDYTLLLDPPSTRQAAAQPVAPTAPQIVNPQPRVTAVIPARPAAAPPAVRSAAPAPAPVATESAGGQQVTVQRGDTAGRLAAAYKPADVSLDQMLVALLRANPDAFINGNVNRMRAGAVLQMPGSNEAASTPAAEARRTVVAQSRDFSEYRRRLAENAPTSQVAAADRQSSGRLQANVEERNANAPSPDRLTIAQGGAAARNEERIAQTRQAQESSARVDELQRNIDELNRLQTGNTGTRPAPAPSAANNPATPAAAPAPAVTTTPGTAATAPASAPTAAPAPAPDSVQIPGLPVQTNPAESTSPTPPTPASPAGEASPAVTAAPTPSPAPAPAPTPAPAPEPGLVDQLLDNPIVPAAGALVLLLLGFLALRLRNRRKSDAADSVFPESRLPKDSFFGATGGESVDTSSRNSSIVSSLSYSPSQLDAGDVDPVAEADVYLAYGRDLQAEEILREALRTTPERLAIHLKLLEIHAKRRDLRAFEQLAGEVRKLSNGDGPEWSRVLHMGRELDPGNPLYQGSAAVLDTEKTVPLASTAGSMAAAGAAATATAAAVAPPPAPAEPVQAFVPSVAPLDFELDLSKPAPLGDARDAQQTPAPVPDMLSEPMSFELPRATPPTPDLRSPLLKHDPLDNDFETAPGELDNLARVDLNSPRVAPTAAAERADSATQHAGLPGDSGFIEFDMTALSGLREGAQTRPAALETLPDASLDTVPADALNVPAAPALDTGADSPHAIKLSLARELHALGDDEGARSLLEEVVAESKDESGKQAQQLLAEWR